MATLFTIFLLSAIITLHELGHFLAAKWCGIPIARFSIGFGKKLWSFRWRATEFQIALIPVGGYVLPAIEMKEFLELPLRQQLFFALGGPLANLVCVLAAVMAIHIGLFGVSVETVLIQPVLQTWLASGAIISAISSLFAQPEQISGVIGIVAAGSEYLKEETNFGWLEFCFMINLNLAIFNLLPILPLDGGRIVMAILQKSYTPLRRLQVPFALSGWLLIIGLMIYATTLDITKLVQRLAV